jgi:uncharacterized membrane protein
VKEVNSLFSSRSLVIILLVALAAGGLRMWNLGGKSLWYDEFLSLEFADQPFDQILDTPEKTNPPFYYVFLRAWKGLFGESEISLRAPSVFFGVLAVALMGWIGFIIGGIGLAWLSALLMTVSAMPLSQSQEARMFALFMAASILSFGSLLCWESRGEKKWGLFYIISTAAMAYTHHYWIFCFLAQQIYLGWRMVRRRVPFWGWADISLGTLVLSLPPLFILSRHILDICRDGLWIPTPIYGDLLETLKGYLLWREAFPSWLIWPYMILVLLGLINVEALGRGLSRRAGVRVPEEPSDRVSFIAPYSGFLILWLCCPLAIPFFLSRAGTSFFWASYTVAAAPALYLLVGRGILNLPGRTARTAVTLAVLLTALMGLRHYYPWQKEDWRGLAREVERVEEPEDVLVAVPPFSRKALAYYYRGLHRIQEMPENLGHLRKDQLRRSITGAVASGGRVWVAARRAPLARPDFAEVFKKRNPGITPLEPRPFGESLGLYGYDYSTTRRARGGKTEGR